MKGILKEEPIHVLVTGADLKNAGKELNYKPKVNLQEGLTAEVEYIQELYSL